MVNVMSYLNIVFFSRGYSKKMAGCIKSYNKSGEQTFNTKYTGK